MLYPSFKGWYGRSPVAGQDYDPDDLCQDDHEYLTGTGQYSDDVHVYPCEDAIDEVAYAAERRQIEERGDEQRWSEMLQDIDEQELASKAQEQLISDLRAGM